MPGSPRGIYVGMPIADLQAIRAAALNRTLNGSFTNLGGAAKNSTREFQDPNDMLQEANFALTKAGVAGYAVGPNRVYQNFSGQSTPATQPVE